MAMPIVRYFDSEEAEKKYYDTHALILIEYQVRKDELGKDGPCWSLEEDRVTFYAEFEAKMTDGNRERLTQLFNKFGPDITGKPNDTDPKQWWYHHMWSLINVVASDKNEADRLISELEEVLPFLEK